MQPTPLPQRGRFDGARLAVGTLTVLRVPAPGVVDARSARTAMLLAPLAGLLPATGAAVVVAAVQALGISLLVAALLALGAAALLTRGLHLDGLADTADGLAAAYDRTKALDVMRRGDVGPAGAVTLVLVVGVQAAALAQAAAQVVAHAGGPGTVRAAVALGVVVLVGLGAGRVTLPLACSRGVRAARPGGLGAAVAGSVPVPGTVLVVAASAAVAAAGTTAVGAGWLPGAAAVLAACAAAGVVLVRCTRRLGGVTGDVLGACVEVGVAAALVTLAATT